MTAVLETPAQAPEQGRPAAARFAPGFRPDVEGLRAVAVLTVLAFHAGVPRALGGFVGVDVFFVISGFLITALMLDEVSLTGTVSLTQFYARRARRILPAAGVALLGTTAASWLLLPPLRRLDTVYDVLASAVSAGNWRFVALQTDYLAANRAPSPVLHYWSLGVEEQFYLAWPALLLLVVWLCRRAGRSWVAALTAGLVLAGGASFALGVHWTATQAPLAYMGTPGRAWEFALGGLVAVTGGLLSRRPLPAWVRWPLGWVGAGLIGYATVVLSERTAFPGTAALWPTAGAALVLLAGFGRRVPASASWLLASRPMREIGRLSFSLYLWHWPVLILTEAKLGPQGWPVKLALVAASAVPAWLTLRLVERPLRFSKAVASRPASGFAVGSTAMVLPALLALVVGAGVLRAQADGTGAVAAHGSVALSGRQSGAVFPNALRARADLPAFDAKCKLGFLETMSPPCLVGPGSSSAPVVLLGDSHATQWFPLASRLAERRGVRVEILSKSGCPTALLTVQAQALGREYRECSVWREGVFRRLEEGPRPSLVLVSSLSRYIAPENQAEAWRSALERLHAIGAPIVYIEDTPFPGKDIPNCVSAHLSAWDSCAFPRAEALIPDPLEQLQSRGDLPWLTTVSANETLCPTALCPAVIDGLLLYRDDSHLTNTAADRMAELLVPKVDALLAAKG